MDPRMNDCIKADAFMAKKSEWIPLVNSILSRGGTVKICPRADGISVLEVKNKQIAFVSTGK